MHEPPIKKGKGGETGCSRRVSVSCFACDTRHVNLGQIFVKRYRYYKRQRAPCYIVVGHACHGQMWDWDFKYRKRFSIMYKLLFHYLISSVAGILYFVGSTVNPILYNVMSKRYRQAFKETICCCIWKTSLSHQRTFMSYAGYYSKTPIVSRVRKTSPPDWEVSGYEHSPVHNGNLRSCKMETPSYSEQVKLLNEQNTDNLCNGHVADHPKNGNKPNEHCPTCSGNTCPVKTNQNTGTPGKQTEMLEVNRPILYPTTLTEFGKVQKMGTCV